MSGTYGEGGADAVRHAFLLGNTTLIRTLAPRGERFRMFRVPEQSAEELADGQAVGGQIS